MISECIAVSALEKVLLLNHELNTRKVLKSALNNKQYIVPTFNPALLELNCISLPWGFFFFFFKSSIHSCADNLNLIRQQKKEIHTLMHTPTVACSAKRRGNQWWYIGKCQTRINGLITLLSILRVLSLLKFPIFYCPPSIRALLHRTNRECEGSWRR